MEENRVCIEFESRSQNEGFARVAVSAFVSQLDPTIEEIADVKTAVSEAVTNCVVHAYPKQNGIITLRCEIENGGVKIIIKDNGIGIKDIEKAKEPFYTTKPSDERSGMGFVVMESFMDKVDVEKNETGGITVTMYKQILGALQVSNAW